MLIFILKDLKVISKSRINFNFKEIEMENKVKRILVEKRKQVHM